MSDAVIPRPSSRPEGGASGAFTLGPALLFCPGSRPDRFPKAAERADAVIADLEDAVGPGQKDQARQNVVHALNGEEPGLDPATTVVRVNTASSGERMLREHRADLDALAGTELRYVVLPKCEDPEELETVAQRLPGVGIIPQIETPRGVLNAAALAGHGSVAALFWGTEDLIAGLGGATARRPDGSFRGVIGHIRHTVLLTAAACGIPAIDTICGSLSDTRRLADESEDAVAEGFTAKACVHPDQVDTVRRAYAPEDADVEWAKALIAVFEQEAGLNAGSGRETAPTAAGAFSFRGEMVDAPVVLHAQRILLRDAAARRS